MDVKWSEQRVQALIQDGEGILVEFKRQWHDLQKAEEKAAFIKDVLAMANSCTQARPGTLLFGVEDARAGGGVPGVSASPTPEAVAQLLTAFTSPPVTTTMASTVVGGRTIDVLAVLWTPTRPHSACRDLATCLKRDVVYVRRGPTVGIASLPEIEVMIRTKDAALAIPFRAQPLAMGFVTQVNWATCELTTRVENISAEPVTSVQIMMEVTSRVDPTMRVRSIFMEDGVLHPGASQESTLKLDSLFGQIHGERLDPRAKTKHRWLDVALHVSYRDHSGYVRRLRDDACLAG